MLPLLACLLLSASALASININNDRGDIPYDGSFYSTSTDTYPIDYNDDFQKPPKNPNSNIYFSFEQIRKDKPSEVDVRVEDVGRYMYRPKVTTSTFAPDLVESRNPIMIPDAFMPPVRYNHHWIDPSTTMGPPPPAPAPKWKGFDLDFRHSPYSQHSPEPRVYEYILKPQHPETTITPENESTNEPKQELSRYNLQPTDEPRVNKETTTSITTTVPPNWTEIATSTESHIQHPMVHAHSGVSTSRISGRGSHKFNWHEPVGPAELTHPVQRPAAVEAAQAPATSAPKSPALPALRRPPPPAPTLTPWAGDNF